MKIPNDNREGFRSTAEWPEGVIPRVQPQKAHQAFLRDNPAVDTVMLQIDYAQRLLRQGHIPETYFDSDLSFITTSTIPDESLKELTWRREAGPVEGLSPAYHIPTDYWVYGDMDLEDRITNIEYLMKGTRYMVRRFKNSPTQIIPLVKGFTRRERAICYDTFDDLGIEYCAFYGSQYFGGQEGNGVRALNRHVRDIVSEYDLEGMLLIGLQSEDYLKRFPPEVVAAAGGRWRRMSSLRDYITEEAKQNFAEWVSGPESQLGVGTATLGSFASNRVMA